MKQHTVLIGLDGATFTILDPLMRDGVMPFLRRFVQQGARAALRTVVPALTPPAWTSLVTGRNPGAHGVFNFFGYESPHSDHIRLLTSNDIQTETIWSMVNRAGMRATVLNFPLTFPAPQIDGYVVPGGWMPWRQLRLGCYPRDLYDQLKQIEGFDPHTLALDMAHEEKALEGCQQDEYQDWIDLHIRRERQWFNVLRYLMQRDPTELTAVLFDGVDKIQHLCWRFLDPAYAHTIIEPWERDVRDRCIAYFRELDALLASISDLAGNDATIVMASDHGFGAQVRTFFANAWLEQHGYLAWADGTGPQANEEGTLGMRQVARHVYLLDWQHTVAYASMPGGNGIQIVRADAQHPYGVTKEAYTPLRDRLIAELEALCDPMTGEHVVAAAWRRETIFQGSAMALAPDVTLELSDGGLMSILASENAVVTRPIASGTHRPDGIFIASGPQIGNSVEAAPLSILDIAPLLLCSLDLPISQEFEGRVPVEVLNQQEHVQPEQRIVGQHLGPVAIRSPTPEPVLDEEEEAEILRRLQALGYVE